MNILQYLTKHLIFLQIVQVQTYILCEKRFFCGTIKLKGGSYEIQNFTLYGARFRDSNSFCRCCGCIIGELQQLVLQKNEEPYPTAA